jgi:predicted CXXCH cytochrome family protein
MPHRRSLANGLLSYAAALAVALLVLASCGGTPRGPGSASRTFPSATATTGRSNVARGDYAGSAACKPCHADIVASWERSPMHRMTRTVPGADLRAPFDGSRWRFKDDAVVMERRGDDRLVRVEAAGLPAKTYKVTRVIGGRTREDYAGTEEGGGREEVVLPVSFVFATRALRYKGYSVMIHERDSLRAGPVWSRACIFCHNTVPEIDRLLGAIAGPAAGAYQGEQVDRWLPDALRHALRVTDDSAFSAVVAGEVARLGGTPSAGAGDPRSVAGHAVDVVRAGFDGDALVEEGIGCEACHGGARDHARDPGVHASLSPVAPWLDVTPPVASPAEAVNRACARCHQVLFSRYPFTWEGGRRDMGAGGSHINSGEGRDFLLGGCARAMACTACHDPHGGGDPARVRAPATADGNAVCTGCHAGEQGAERARAHSHHDPSGAAGACVACHMPRKNMGLDGRLTRYHRIGSPTDSARVLGDRPLECALCHADWSAGRIVDAMEKGWKVRYPRQRIEELYGSLDANVLRATLERGKPHEQAVAIAALAEARARDAAPLVARQLLNPYPLVRQWAASALGALVDGGRCQVDLAADDATLARQAIACGADPASLSLPRPAAGRDEDPED